MNGKIVKIAVCDDDKQERKSIVRYIECYYHYGVVPILIQELDGKEVLFDELMHNGFDVVFVCFDGGAGIEAARKIRKMSNTCKVIMINNSSDFAIEAHNIWVNYYGIKPVRYDYICNALIHCE